MRDLLAQSTELQGPRNRQGDTLLARNVIALSTVVGMGNWVTFGGYLSRAS